MDKLSNNKVRDFVFNKNKGHCAYCGCIIKRNKFVIDHINPLRRGETDKRLKGQNSVENYNPSCVSCNSSKNELSLDKWRHELSLKIMRLNRDSSQYRLMKRFGLIKETGSSVVFYFEKQ